MAHGVSPVKRAAPKEKSGGAGSRRIFAPHFKLQVLDSYRNDADCKGNQRATARKYGIHRRQIQKWLQAEPSLRSSVGEGIHQTPEEPIPMDLSLKRAPSPAPALDLSNKKPVKLFKPYLDDEEHKPPPPTRCAAACCNNNVMDYGGYTLHELQPAAATTTTTTYFYHPLPYYEDQCYMVKYKLQKWLKQEDEMR